MEVKKKHQSLKKNIDPILHTDVVIVGGGIAGNYLACLLAGLNVSCIVLEEHTQIGLPFQCAGIISQKILKLVDFPKDLILNRIKKVEIISPSYHKIIMSGKESPIVINRVGFDAYFGKKAQTMGVKYYLGEKYILHKSISTTDEVLVKTSKRRIISKLVVGADGPFSKVARNFGIKNTVIPAVQARVKFDYDLSKTSMQFHPDMLELFGYIVPEGKNGVCRIGLATKKHPNRAFKKFLKSLTIPQSQTQILSKQGGVLPFGFPTRFIFQNTLLLGDSACMVKATTGGGIVMLISATKILATAIKKSIIKQDWNQEFFRKNYGKPIKFGIGIQLKIHYFIRLILMRLEPRDFDRFFKLYNDHKIHSIIDNYADMDFPFRVIKELLKNKKFIAYFMNLLINNLEIIPIFFRNFLK